MVYAILQNCNWIMLFKCKFISFFYFILYVFNSYVCFLLRIIRLYFITQNITFYKVKCHLLHACLLLFIFKLTV